MSTAGNRKTVLDPWGTTVVEDYNRLCEEFGIQRFKSLLAEIPNPSMYMRRGVIFGHRDFES
ncbi:MAG: tryptophan--tRNA ligase, partial [Candidatus Bathyarchaeota archaeon]|nr:tryptophan--tRNA ligase [Candidatus Bathyarchaeota archaeon]